MDDEFLKIANLVGAPAPEVIRGRSYPRRFDTDKLKKTTLQKMCRLSLIDFCCLNYEMPPECLEDDSIAPGLRPRCQWIPIESRENEKYITSVLI